MKQVYIAFLIAVLVCAGCSASRTLKVPPLTDAAAGDRLIVPNERVGGIQLDMTQGDLFSLAGPATTSADGTLWIYYGFNIGVYGGTVSSISVYDRRFHTENGVTPGMAYADYRRLLGAPDHECFLKGKPLQMFYRGLEIYWPVNNSDEAIEYNAQITISSSVPQPAC